MDSDLHGIPIESKESRDSLIDTAKAAEKFRARILDMDNRKILVTNFLETEQAKDLTEPPNCEGLGRVRHFRRATAQGWPSNPLPIDPAVKSLGKPDADMILAQAFQNAACAWRCWYCFVPFDLLSGSERHSRWITADELLDLYLQEVDRPPMIDLTGGSPDLTPDWIIWMMQAIRGRGLEGSIYLWSDDNLSTDYLWTKLTPQDHQLMRDFKSYGRVACFKGFDPESFQFNTRARPEEFDQQFARFRKLLDFGIDLYAYATFTGPDSKAAVSHIPEFIDRLQELHPNLPLRTIPLRIAAFTPVQPRMTPARQGSLAVQEEAISIWNSELERRYSPEERAAKITEVALGR